MIAAPTMAEAAQNTLQQIAAQLDASIFPRVRNGGFVTPSDSAAIPRLGEESCYDDQRGSATRSRKGATGWEGSTGRSRSTSKAPSLIGGESQNPYDEELDAVRRAYPATKIWQQKDGLGLLVESSVLADLRRAAVFVVGVSYSQRTARAWGFWRNCSLGLAWIGPRHTNFPDGSICAFLPSDETWQFGDPLVELLDLYSVWAMRHLHLEVFGRWPGPQAALHPFERILELRGDECCGCGSARRYAECCQRADQARNRVADAVSFAIYGGGRLRQPPASIVRAALEASEPPSLTRILDGWRM